MINVTYSERNKKPIKTDICWQWDYNQVLRIKEIPFAIVPEIHFWQEGMEKALVVKGSYDKDKHYHSVTAVIPNYLLQVDEPITAYLYDETDGEYGETLGVYQIPVMTREQPEDYEYFENVSTTLSTKFKEYDEKFASMQDLLDFMDRDGLNWCEEADVDEILKVLSEPDHPKPPEEDNHEYLSKEEIEEMWK